MSDEADDFPHKCPRCKHSAYIAGNQTVDCSNRRCHHHARYVGIGIKVRDLVDKAYALKDEIWAIRRDKRAQVAMASLELVTSELLGEVPR